MDLGSVLLLLLVLACPLAMFWMMRGGHGAHGQAAHGADCHGAGHGHDAARESRSVEELRRRRARLDDEIANLERAAGVTDRPSAEEIA